MPGVDARGTLAFDLMARFAERTGLTSDRPERRYLWTDAFAVCNFLGLANERGDASQIELAVRLVDRVHHVLGRHRPDDSRRGWISGLPEEEAERHPTLRGLRIGKARPERAAGERIDERLEWERDGQYFHYLTKWMHALEQVSRVTGQPSFNCWGRELARCAHAAFRCDSAAAGRPRMYWKLSIDLSRPLVTSMGQHDPLDGFVSCLELSAGADGLGPCLEDAISDFAALIDPRALATADPLGIGGLLVDAYRLAQLGQSREVAVGLIEALLDAALAGLARYAAQPDLRLQPAHRLAFRELGLSIGLAACGERKWPAASTSLRRLLDRISPYARLRADIDAFWMRGEHRRSHSWVAHEDINDVMLATSLRPDGFLVLAPSRPAPAAGH
jgi:hypothetical protein